MPATLFVKPTLEAFCAALDNTSSVFKFDWQLHIGFRITSYCSSLFVSSPSTIGCNYLYCIREISLYTHVAPHRSQNNNGDKPWHLSFEALELLYTAMLTCMECLMLVNVLYSSALHVHTIVSHRTAAKKNDKIKSDIGETGLCGTMVFFGVWLST
jgi:hypothetical protein